jgi:hypothetical protein
MNEKRKEYQEKAMRAVTNEAQRKVIDMRGAGCTYAEIGQELGMSSGNAAVLFDKYSKMVDNFVRVLELADEQGGALNVPISELRHISPKYGFRFSRAADQYLLMGLTLKQVVASDPKFLASKRGIGPKTIIGFMDDVKRHFRRDKSVFKMTRYYVSRIDYSVKSPIPNRVMEAMKAIRECGYSVVVKSKYDQQYNKSRKARSEATRCQ